MRIVLPALTAAALVAGIATTVVAQTPTAPTNPNTKVYAYKKAMPTQPAPATALPGKPTEHLPTSVPYGSAKWWEIMGWAGHGSAD